MLVPLAKWVEPRWHIVATKWTDRGSMFFPWLPGCEVPSPPPSDLFDGGELGWTMITSPPPPLPDKPPMTGVECAEILPEVWRR